MMKKLLLPCILMYLSVAISVPGASTAHGGVLFDAAEQLPVRLWKPEQKATYENGSLRLEWDTDRNNICDMTFPKRRDRPIAAFDEANCLVELELPPNSPVNNFNVRFIDSRDEVFQWRVPLVAGKGGKRVVKLKISPKNFFVSFRGNADGRIDFPIYFYSCATSAPRGGGKVSLALNKIDFESTRKTELHEARFELETGNTPRILLPGRERDLTFLLSNPGQTPLVCDATFTLQDTLGHVITLPKERLIIPARGKITRKPELSLPARGIWYVTLRLEREDGSYVERIRSFALMSPAGPLRTPARTDAFLFGVCVPSISRPQLFDREAETAALCGATALRANFRWRDMERKPGLWDLSVQEKLLKSYGKYHIEVLPILSNPPAWARRDRPNSTPDFTAWREYTGRMFRHFRGRIRFWEIWNEPDLRGFAEFGPVDYVQLQKIAREEQRRLSPESRLLTGGFTTMLPHKGIKKGFQEYVLKHAGDYFDIHAFHGHCGYQRYLEQIRRLLAERAGLGVTAPWYANETAVSSIGIGEQGQAETLARKLLFSWSEGAIGYNWYNLRNNGTDPANPEYNYGLVTEEFYPRAAYVAYNTLTTLFRGKRFVSRLNPASGEARLLEFAGDGDRVLSLWLESASGNEQSILLRSDAERVEAVDLMGNRRNLPVSCGQLLWNVSTTPEFLLFHNCRRLEFGGKLLSCKLPPYLLPKQASAASVSCVNPFDRPVTLRLELGGTALSVSPATAVVTLAPGEKKMIPIELVGHGEAPVLKIRAAWPGGSAGVAEPLPMAKWIPRHLRRGEWNFLLRQRQQVQSLFEADPANVHRLWRGAKDLSAGIRLGMADDALLLTVEVTDDRHVQPYHESSIWQADSIQFGFAVPGRPGMWVAGAALCDDGSAETWIWDAPGGFAGERRDASWRIVAERRGDVTRYALTIPLDSVGLSREQLTRGIRFNLLVNDNDGEGRDGWIQLEEGIASERDAEKFPLLVFEP